VSQYWQRSGQPVRRTNTVGQPAVSASPCREWKISVIRRRVTRFCPRAMPYCEGVAATRRSRSAASLAESLPGYLRITSVSVARAAAFCFCAYCV